MKPENSEDKQCLKDEINLMFNKVPVHQPDDQNWIIK